LRFNILILPPQIKGFNRKGRKGIRKGHRETFGSGLVVEDGLLAGKILD
jgi:hypothetical protein